MEVLRRMDYLIKRVFNDQNRPTFLHYRASQSRGLTRGMPSSSLACMRQMHSNFHTVLKFRVYLISYTRLFTKLNLFDILFYGTFIAIKISRSTVDSVVGIKIYIR